MTPEGIYPDMPDADYRSAEGVCQSELKRFGEASTPLHYFSERVKGPKKQTEDMAFGTLCHSAVLKPDTFDRSYHLRPDGYKTKDKEVKPWHGGAEWCKKWISDHSDKPVFTKQDLLRADKVKHRLMATEFNDGREPLTDFIAALNRGQTEVSFFKQDEETGLMLKCRTDLIAVDDTQRMCIFDLKKVQSGRATEKHFAASCMDFGYDIQAASYLHITGASWFVFVVFDDDEPFDAIQHRPDSEFIERGYRRWRNLLLRYAACVKENKWPGYAGGISHLSLPEWARNY